MRSPPKVMNKSSWLKMYATFGDFGSYFAPKAKSYIDNATFALHYRLTFGLLIMASLLTVGNQFIGAPMQCMVEGVPGGIMDTYCWIHGTFTLPSQLVRRVGEDVAHPGVAPLSAGKDDLARGDLDNLLDRGHVAFTEDGDEIRHAWYQWVAFLLVIQALLCYLPHYLWKQWEGGKMSMLVQGLDAPLLSRPHEEMNGKRFSVVAYMLRTLNTHNSYVAKFVFCEALNVINIFFQIFLMDVFLNNAFSDYGWQVLNVSELPMENRTDPMNKVFPKVTKCTFHKYGPSGTVENKDGLCVLALNIINEKIYVFLWFWYVFLAVWTSIHLIFRLSSVASTYVRYILLCKRSPSVNRDDVNVVVRKCTYGDWFLLMQMAKFVNPMVFHDIMLDLRDRLDAKRADNLNDN